MRMIPLVARSTAMSLLLVVAAAMPASAASSVAYVDKGSVWLSTLDGSQKVKLADPVPRSDETGSWQDEWLDVAQSDGGRIVAARNKPGRMSSFSWFQVWEPDGTSTVQGPLNAPSGQNMYVYPVGFDVTPDGKHLVYGYSNWVGFGLSTVYTQGTYVRPATDSVLPPIGISGVEYPSLFGNRVVARAGSIVSVQVASPGSPYPDDFTPWIDSSGTGLTQARTDVAATGTLAALELENTSATPEIGKIAVLSTQGVDASLPSPAAVDCFLPASGVAHEASLSQDATKIAWSDADGLKVAGVPTTAADPCVLSAPAVLISATGRHGSIGSADVAAFLPKPVPAPTPVPVPVPTPPAPTPPAPAPTPPSPTPPAPTAPAAPSLAQVKVTPVAAKFAAVQRTGSLPVSFPVREANVRARLVVRLSAKQAKVFGLKPPRRSTSLIVGTGTAMSTRPGQIVKVSLRSRAFAATSSVLRRAPAASRNRWPDGPFVRSRRSPERARAPR